MVTPSQDTRPSNQREALKQSQKQAAAPQPENFKDAETEDKVVEIGPDMQDAPIEGIDPPDSRGERAKESRRSSAGEEDPNAALDDPAVRDAMLCEKVGRSK